MAPIHRARLNPCPPRRAQELPLHLHGGPWRARPQRGDRRTASPAIHLKSHGVRKALRDPRRQRWVKAGKDPASAGGGLGRHIRCAGENLPLTFYGSRRHGTTKLEWAASGDIARLVRAGEPQPVCINGLPFPFGTGFARPSVVRRIGSYW